MDFLNIIWLIPILPLLGALVNGTAGKRWPHSVVAALGCGTVGLGFVLSLGAFVEMLSTGQSPVIREYFTWISAGPFVARVGFQFDQLSGLMALLVTGVGFLIHLYSVGYMSTDTGFYRYFSYLNLFVFSMLTLVLAHNYLLMFVGWEGVGLCSYLLIGFWFDRKAPPEAGKKAFIVNRVGDFGFILALLLMFRTFGSLDFQRVFDLAGDNPAAASATTAICLLMLFGATGKSAQIPLYVWLPDAMEGPTPVSALIHAATMVTAGVYMVTRSAALFEGSATAMTMVAIIGTLTAFFAATIAIVQTDIKRVLAYSTISQLGYMFVACGVGAWAAGIFHLMTHAFFKALLFLAAGSVIHGMDGVQDLQSMGGLRRRMPWTFRTFLIGGLALAGIPGFAGFFSKDAILWGAWTRGGYGPLLWAAGVVTAGLTSFYTFRLVFLAFFGESRYPDDTHVHESPSVMVLPLIVLALLSVLGGYIGVPAVLGGSDVFERFLEPVAGPLVASQGLEGSDAAELLVMAVSVLAVLIGLLLAWRMYGGAAAGRLSTAEPSGFRRVHRVLVGKYYIDEIYDRIIVKPMVWVSRNVLWRGVDSEVIDGVVNGTGAALENMAGGLRHMQSGSLRIYAAWILGGGVLVAVWLLG